MFSILSRALVDRQLLGMNYVAAAYGGVAIVIAVDWLVRGRYVHRRLSTEELSTY